MKNEPIILVLDKDRADSLNYVISVYSQLTDRKLPGMEASKDFQAFHPGVDGIADELSQKTHERGWCTDPDCPLKDWNK